MSITIKLPFSKVMKKFLITFIILYISICTIIIAKNHRSFGLIFHVLNPKLVKLNAQLEVGTGPMHCLKDDDGKKLLKSYYANIDTYEIELTGYTPYTAVDDPAEIGDLIVYGYFDGVTDKYKVAGYDNIPVFKVEYYDYLTYSGFSLYLSKFAIFGFPMCIFSTIGLIGMHKKRIREFV